MAVPSPSPASAKDMLRLELRAKRRAYAASLPADTRAALEAQLAHALAPALSTARIIAGYQPMTDEISPLPALDHALALGRTIALPAFAARDSRMTFRAGAATEAGPWGIHQPALDAPAVHPDLILIPLVACDLQGNRIGMGKGHYDRALDGIRTGCRLIGIGWDFQLLDAPFSAESWDQRLDAFASPSGLTDFFR